MIRDLSQEPADQHIAARVLIIGGGIAGLILAARLRERNIPVVVLESGDRAQTAPTHPLNEVVQLGTPYRGAAQGRFRCLGGTSTRWGGAMLPFLAADLAARPWLDLPAWPVSFDQLAPHIAALEALFGVDTGPYDGSFIRSTAERSQLTASDDDFDIRFAKWPVFAKRNVATLLDRQIGQDADFQVWLNATAVAFTRDAATGRLASVTAGHEGGRRLTVDAGHVVLAAGAIETTRLLLLLDQQAGGGVFPDSAGLGRYFHDHVSKPLAEIRSDTPVALNRLAAYRFNGSTMRSARFELSPAAQEADRVGSAFGHISFEAVGPTGFSALRDTLRAVQRTGRPDGRALAKLATDLPYLVRAGYWRAVHRQLLWPRPARYHLHVVAEQVPRASNRITLDARRDRFGCPLAAIDWRVTDAEHAVYRAYARRFDAYWQRHGLQGAGHLSWLGDGDRADADTAAGDVFHPGGTTRMGHDARSGVVDGDLTTYAVGNLSVASTSTFPSGASANPTMMLMLLTLRLGDHLAAELGTVA